MISVISAPMRAEGWSTVRFKYTSFKGTLNCLSAFKMI